jgi:hypothetical protein
MRIFLLIVDPDNGDSVDVETVAFNTRVGAEAARQYLIEDGCESVLEIRELPVSDSWKYNHEEGVFKIVDD